MRITKQGLGCVFGLGLVTALAGCGDKEETTTGQANTANVSLGSSSDESSSDETGTADASTDTTSTDTGTTDTTDTSDTTDTDTDTDTDTTGPDGCSDSDSGNAPAPNDVDDVDAPDGEPEPFGGFGFVPPDDGGPGSECDIFLQDCPDGEKCVPYASGGGNWDANKCVPVVGDGMVGESCVYGGVVEATDDCDENSACWDVKDMDGQPIGTCTAFCEGTPLEPVCPAGTSCLQSGNGSIAFCVDGCNPLTQQCPDGEACFWSGDAFNCIFTTSDVPTGQPCGFINDCAEGNMCVTGELVPNCIGSACCAAFCDLDCEPEMCGPGTTCVPFFEQGMAPLGSADVGVCLSM